MKFSQAELTDIDTRVMNSPTYQSDTWEIITEMDLSPTEKTQELNQAFDSGEITSCDLLKGIDKINSLTPNPNP